MVAATDEHVLRALMRHRRLTRAELAAATGISKPTATESVRRLTERGLVADTGERTPGGRGRGRVGTYYALTPAVGTALAVTIAPEGVTAACLDVYGDTLARERAGIDGPVGAVLSDVVARVRGAAGPQPLRVAVVSAADPVERSTGALVHLPDSPFLVGALDPVAILAPHVDGPVVVDNDVNWAAAAERDHVAPRELRDFAYLYLGEGLGCAIVSDGGIRRGRSGLTGEIAHLLTAGPGGRAVHLIDVFGLLGLRLPGTTAIDVPGLLADTASHEAVGTAVAGVVAALIALADPEEVVVGGSWGPALIDAIRAAAGREPRTVPVVATRLSGSPAFAGVRAAALDRLRALVTGAVAGAVTGQE